MTIEKIQFPVHGMVCASCVGRIMRAVRRLGGIERVSVDLRRETATVTLHPSIVTYDEVAAAITGAGYEPDMAARVVLPATEPRGLVAAIFGR